MKSLIFSAVIVLTVSLCSLAYGIHETMVDGEKIPMPGADAAKLYRYITLPKHYDDKWMVWPAKGKMYAGQEPHGAFITTFLNNEALNSTKTGNALADGSIIVMESYGADKKLDAISVAYKIEGYNAKSGDWFYAKYNPLNGYVLESGDDSSCIKCHGDKRIDNFFLKK